jgi:hypothetical protein
VRGVLPGTSAFISKDRILSLDVSHVRGNELRIRIHPPAGFWALNSFSVDYTPDQPVTLQKLKPATAQSLDGRNVLSELEAVDDRYLAMPNIGDTADITFQAPPAPAGLDRVVFLHSRGYYKLHIDATGEPDKATLRAFAKVPGTAVRFAATQYSQSLVARQEGPK